MRGWLALVAVSVVSVSATAVAEAARPVTVYLERNGKTVSSKVKIPAYGGGDRAWNQVVSCVANHFAPFQVEVTDRKPSGDHITAVVGGWASQLGLSDSTTNGVGPYNGDVIPNATVYIFSKVGSGERDVSNLCAVTAHEVAHSMGLDHSYKCGDIMSYYLDRCGPRRFLDVDAHCGEFEARACANGDSSQNSYRRLGQLVGFRSQPQQPDDNDDTDDSDVDESGVDESEDADDIWGSGESEDADDDGDDAEVEQPQPNRGPAVRGHNCGGHAKSRVIYRYRVYRVYRTR